MKKIRKQKITRSTEFLIPVLLLCLALFAGVNAVSAADNDTIYVNTNTGNDSWDGLNSTYDPITHHGPKLSIKNATGTVNTNGVIKLANGTYTGVNNTGITIYKSMAILGESQAGTIINGENTYQIFHILPGVNLILQNLTLTNAKGVGNGAINNEGTLNVANSTFTGNIAAYDFNLGGGAIYNNGGNCNLVGCTFIGNTAFDFGGAIYNNEGTLNVANSTFTGNTATYAGGAIFNIYGTLNVANSTFTGNTATYYGGAISNYFGTCTVNFNRIVGNTASAGNAIFNAGSVNAENNWWGSNNPNWSNLIIGFANNPTNWVILSINATPNHINNTQTSTIIADFNHINGGGDLVGGHIPDGSITLSIPWGSLDWSGHSITEDTVNGVINPVTFYANEGAIIFNPVKVTATADGYTTNSTESAYININKTVDLYLTITGNNNNPTVGQTFTVTYKLGNKGPDNATNVTITIPLPSGFKVSNISGDGTWIISGNTIIWTLTNVPVGDPYLYVRGWFVRAGNFVFNSSITSDNYNINTQGVTPLSINAKEAASKTTKTVGMQNTGIPIAGLILAILAVFGGLVLPKRK